MKNFLDRARQNFPFVSTLSRDVENAYNAYETSFETDNLKSEENRKIYSELIECHWGKDWNRKYKTISKSSTRLSLKKPSNVAATDDDFDDERNKQVVVADKSEWWRKIELKKSNQPKSLKLMALEEYAKNFKRGGMDERIFCQDAVEFGYLAPITLPFSQSLLEFDNETYWKRIVISKCKDNVKLQQIFRSKNTDWKKNAVELFVAEYCGKLKPSESKFFSVKQKVKEEMKIYSKFIRNLCIESVQHEIRELCNDYNSDIKTINYKSEECTHFPFDFIGQLSNIEQLSISFKTLILGKNYQRRFFQVALNDIRDIADGLSNLKNLRELQITETSLEEPEKIFHLLSSLQNLKCLQVLTLTHCNINSEKTGGYFEEFLSQNSSLEKLDLSHNDLGREFCLRFAMGLEKSSCTLKYLGLSMTEIFYNGLDVIIRSISKRDYVEELNISCCLGDEFDENNSVIDDLQNLIRISKNLKILNMSANIIIEESERNQIIDALIENFHFKLFECSFCGFTISEQIKIKVLSQRNNYYHENPILKKEKFSREDEIEIEQWLRRTKHPLLLKYKKEFSPTENLIKWKNEAEKKIQSEPIENYEMYAFVSK